MLRQGYFIFLVVEVALPRYDERIINRVSFFFFLVRFLFSHIIILETNKKQKWKQ